MISPERIAALRAENEALRAGLHEARLQLEYLDGRFATGTTPAVVARITALLAKGRAMQ